MGVLSIVVPAVLRPLNGPGSNIQILKTPDPKEAWVITAGQAHIDIAFDSQQVDTVFVGYTTGMTTNGNVRYQLSNDGGTTFIRTQPMQAANSSGGAPQHFFDTFAAVTATFIRIYTEVPGSTGTVFSRSIGVVGVGKSFAPTFGREQGSGRAVIDTGDVSRLPGGGFSINPGARVGTFAWTFGDLSDAETETLYAIARRVGTTSTLLVVEDVDLTTGLNERLHWSILDKIQPYTRLDPGKTKWDLSISEWG